MTTRKWRDYIALSFIRYIAIPPPVSRCHPGSPLVGCTGSWQHRKSAECVVTESRVERGTLVDTSTLVLTACARRQARLLLLLTRAGIIPPPADNPPTNPRGGCTLAPPLYGVWVTGGVAAPWPGYRGKAAFAPILLVRLDTRGVRVTKVSLGTVGILKDIG